MWPPWCGLDLSVLLAQLRSLSNLHEFPCWFRNFFPFIGVDSQFPYPRKKKNSDSNSISSPKIFCNESQQCIGLIRRTTKMTRPLPFSNGRPAWSGLPRGEDIDVGIHHPWRPSTSPPRCNDEFPKVRASMNSGDEGGSLVFLWSIGMSSLYSRLVWFTSLPLSFYSLIFLISSKITQPFGYFGYMFFKFQSLYLPLANFFLLPPGRC